MHLIHMSDCAPQGRLATAEAAAFWRRFTLSSCRGSLHLVTSHELYLCDKERDMTEQ